jgi:drug/metabolite transporter (DMT)-like permease
MSPLTWGYLVALSIVWGGTFFFQEVAVRELPTFSIVACRVAIAALLLWGVTICVGTPLPNDPKIWAALFLLALINNVIPFSLIVWGQREISSGLAAILNATVPLFTVLIAHFVTDDEKLTGPKIIGVVFGLLGVAVIIGEDALDGIGIAVLAQLAVLGAALAYTLGGLYGRKIQAMGLTPLGISTGQLLASTVVLVPVALLVDEPWTLPVPGMETIAAVVALASVSTAFAYILFFRILATAGATNLMLVTFLIPVSALALGILILGEALEARHILGLLCIGAGLAAIDGRIFRRRQAP